MSEPQLYVPVILGTTREGRKSIHAAQLVVNIGHQIPEVDTELIDVRDFFPPPGEGNDEQSKDPRWVEINKEADAYFIVTPEYNHGYPGSLKLLLDNDLGNYTHKPVQIAGVSAGMWGGTRVVENLLPVVRELGMVATFAPLYFPKINELFDAEGALQDEGQRDRVRSAWDKLIWMAKALRWGRENLDDVSSW